MPGFEEYCEEIRCLWDSRLLTNHGDKHNELQRQLCAFFQSEYVELFTNGHLALEALLTALSLRGEVITTPYTFASTAHAIVRKGLTPVFCDVREEDYTIDPSKLENLITERTCAILPVHVYGYLCDVDAIQKIADKDHLPVIYDAAHAFGVTRGGVPAARYGLASMFSFHATKVYHTIEGGAVVTENAALQGRLALERNFGIAGPEDVLLAGGNAKMNEFQAAMGLCNLRHVQEDIRQCKHVYERYAAHLKGTPNLRLPPVQPGIESNYAYFPVVLEGGRGVRDALCDALKRKGIFARKYFYPLVTDYECYRDKPGFTSSLTPVASRISDGIVTLPIYPGLSDEDVALISREVRRSLGCG